MSRPPLATRYHFSRNAIHRTAVLNWLVSHRSICGTRRSIEKHRDVMPVVRREVVTPPPMPPLYSVEREAGGRDYILFNDDPEELLDGYEGKLSPSKYQQHRHHA